MVNISRSFLFIVTVILRFYDCPVFIEIQRFSVQQVVVISIMIGSSPMVIKFSGKCLME